MRFSVCVCCKSISWTPGQDYRIQGPSIWNRLIRKTKEDLYKSVLTLRIKVN
jgi:hypothetical protein